MKISIWPEAMKIEFTQMWEITALQITFYLFYFLQTQTFFFRLSNKQVIDN